MAGWVQPAMDGPAGQERGQDAVDGGRLRSRRRVSLKAAGSMEATWWPGRAMWSAVTLATRSAVGTLEGGWARYNGAVDYR